MTGYFLADQPPPLPGRTGQYSTASSLATAIAGQILVFFDSVANQSSDKWSPQVVQTLYWWFERWGYTYLFATEDDAGDIIGVPGGGDWKGLASWGIARMRKDIEGWAGEKEIISQVFPFPPLTRSSLLSRHLRVSAGSAMAYLSAVSPAQST
jgi:hypothetical protein